MIASVDESVGRIMALLDELKLSDNTLVIFGSDNGGVGGYEREGIQGGSITDNAPLRGGKGMLYEGGIRVPYIFRWPGKIAPGAVCDEPIHNVDLYPTLLELAGTPPPANYPLDGTSYLDLLTRRRQGGARPASAVPAFPRLSRRRRRHVAHDAGRRQSAPATGNCWNSSRMAGWSCTT